MAKKHVTLLVIDPLNDFCDPKGALYVNGADEDCLNLARFIGSNISNIDSICVFMDKHPLVSIWSPIFWVNKEGNHPGDYDFTDVPVSKVLSGELKPAKEEWYDRALAYVKDLERNNKNVLTIWPPHCLVGTSGQNIYPIVNEALKEWQITNKKNARYISKGTNPFTEHYSALQAEVPDLNDNSTLLNVPLIHEWHDSDIIIGTGEASSHCVAETFKHLVYEFNDNPEDIKKIVLLSDTMSPVKNFEKNAQAFFDDMVAKGVNIITSKEFSI